ncbi:hypothetical protein ATE47_01395 [Chryseobacterium sp. IHB B 17019]|uniref:RagB/SusD family nutrient uptake outer membrane protein n=1 Tax=Chryseobacterium sp. IHB B 17019 TaxID=1721091 RepID=UPI00071F6692|nr:RagB/SusD family nutrient uptake outer membrane protein [Chryseobacterium sp. IHB B 17019]ALR29267.1 hypothetical protein ATE47_01395 [Chryseobacterium sp. IHB B 17019]
MKKEILIILIILLAIFGNGCKKFVEVGPPSDKTIASTVFENESTAKAAIVGLYARMTSNSLYFTSGGTTAYLGLYSDELFYTSTSVVTSQFSDSKLAANNGTVYGNFWGQAYQLIYAANSCINGLKTSAINTELRVQLLGEAYFVRAYCYWTLVSLFGDVPLVLQADDYAATVQMTRTPSSEVVNQVLADMNEARKSLKPAYPTSGRFRPNYFTVMAMLSRINTYLGKWNDVLSNCNEVIGNSAYGLENDLNKVFLIGSNEVIWQMSYDQPLTNTYEGSNFIPTTAATTIPLFALRNTLYNAFTVADKRKTSWTSTKTVSGTLYAYPFKYKVRSSSIKTEAQAMIRLSEVYLNRAEAKAHLNDVTALDDLNKIRNRAGLTNISGLSGQPLINEILNERRLELFAEWGLRWFDLKRTNQLDHVIGPLKSGWVNTAVLWPIPNNEILSSPNLTQNPGYN